VAFLRVIARKSFFLIFYTRKGIRNLGKLKGNIVSLRLSAGVPKTTFPKSCIKKGKLWKWPKGLEAAQSAAGKA